MIPAEGLAGEKLKQVIKVKINNIEQWVAVMESGEVFDLILDHKWGHIDNFKDPEPT